MGNVVLSKHGNCPSNFRMQRRSDMLAIGFGGGQMESREFVERMASIGKKTGLLGRSDGFTCAHWKLENNGYPEGFENYKTYGRYWWKREN